MKKNIVLFIVFVIFQSCGYFENDEIEVIAKITDGYEVVKQNNSEEYELALQKSMDTHLIINENCVHVVFDSKNNLIFTERYLNPHNSAYFQIKIIQDKKFKKIELTKDQYFNKINECANCVEKFIFKQDK